MTRPILAVPKGFDPPVVEKVERLLEMLDAVANNPYLKSRLILHGGTALNVFHADMPRLSVDIDLAYVGSPTAEGMLEERPRVDGEVRALAAKLGYAARSLHNEHSGQSYRLRYDADSIKVDVSYLARVPLLEPVMLACSRCRPTVAFATLQLPELVAGKVSALVDRTAPRDLYDIARLATAVEAPRLDSGLARSVVLHALSLTDRFPFERDPAGAADKFAEPTEAQVQELRGVLTTEDPAGFDDMRARVAAYLSPLSILTPAEAEYMELLGTTGQHVPELLFGGWPDIAERARISPVVAWKVQNLRRLLGR
ncbi:MAG: nucleotidyl transferase AbiEii/AbiGii toxin family protein [Actinomycetota bacterium]|nr:nucleotidyl transferase AbiEii/AbiGii toxin family protein [Actinomycetota bacterium]